MYYYKILVCLLYMRHDFLLTGVPQQIRRDKPHQNSRSGSRLHQEGQVLSEEADGRG